MLTKAREEAVYQTRPLAAPSCSSSWHIAPRAILGLSIQPGGDVYLQGADKAQPAAGSLLNTGLSLRCVHRPERTQPAGQLPPLPVPSFHFFPFPWAALQLPWRGCTQGQGFLIHQLGPFWTAGFRQSGQLGEELQTFNNHLMVTEIPFPRQGVTREG